MSFRNILNIILPQLPACDYKKPYKFKKNEKRS